MIGLVDCNNFYASCERLFNPKLRNVPVVVLSNNDGCVIARSAETKALGIKMGTPLFKIKDEIKKYNIKVCSSNYELYGDVSARVMTELGRFTPEIEVYSIDESFLNLDGFKNLDSYVQNIRDTVIRNTGIPVCIGVGKSKTLAKVANKISKKSDGYLVLDTQDKTIEALKSTSVGDVWGIGSQHEKRLIALGIENAFQLSTLSQQWALKNMSIVGVRLIKELNGFSCMDLELVAPAKQTICCSRSFGIPQNLYCNVTEGLANHVSHVALKLRKEKLATRTINVFLQTNHFNATAKQHAASQSITLDFASNSTSEVLKYAFKALKTIYKEGYAYKKVGIIAMDLIPENNVQLHLFGNNDQNEVDNKAMKAMDVLNVRFGNGKVKIASQGFSSDWKLKTEFISNRFTTRWDEVIKVK